MRDIRCVDEPYVKFIETKKARPIRPKKAALTKKRAGRKSTNNRNVLVADPLKRYLREISRYKILPGEEQRQLAIRAREKDDKIAADELVNSNLRLVVKIALDLNRIWMQNLLDLIQEGNIGLMHAVKKYDPYRKIKFSYYASFWIRAYMLKCIMDNWRLVKIGTTQAQRKLFFKLKKEKRKLEGRGIRPSPSVLARRLDVSEDEIINMDQRLNEWDLSLDAPLNTDTSTSKIELFETDSESVEERVSEKEIRVVLHEKVSVFRENITERERDIFDQRIFSETPTTLREIGQQYGISRERVRQVEKNVIKKLRAFFQQELPDFYVYAN